MIDIGNTKTKYAHFVSDRIKEKGVCNTEEISKIVYVYSEKVKNIMLSSVKPIPDLVLSKPKNKDCKLVVLSSELEMPFKTSYNSPETLGSDRLALIAGAVSFFPNRPVLIIDAGTCITFDFVDSKKNHLGGAISPGLQMRLNALESQTSALPTVNLREPYKLIGDSTENSILSGVVNGAIKELDGTIDTYKKRYPETIVLITGGDLGFFDKKLKNSIFADEDILLKGMYFIQKHYANK
tara:strand:+ start:159 stop:875 length:717 start_codon:yes stop_codon:yes gene_type:complete